MSVDVPGGFHHVTARGDKGAALFYDKGDFSTLLRYLATAVERFGWLCHAFCLMPNHYHLLLETPEQNLGRGMLVINGSYARYFNRRQASVGHVFQGPYHPEPVARDEHFQECCRYIVRNPVKAGLCASPFDWPWSSYRATAALAPPPPFLTVDFVRSIFGSPKRFAAFCNQVESEEGAA